jgi:hypothetical protein
LHRTGSAASLHQTTSPANVCPREITTVIGEPLATRYDKLAITYRAAAAVFRAVNCTACLSDTH